MNLWGARQNLADPAARNRDVKASAVIDYLLQEPRKHSETYRAAHNLDETKYELTSVRQDDGTTIITAVTSQNLEDLNGWKVGPSQERKYTFDAEKRLVAIDCVNTSGTMVKADPIAPIAANPETGMVDARAANTAIADIQRQFNKCGVKLARQIAG